MSATESILHLHDLDLLAREYEDPAARGRLKKLGLAHDPGTLLDRQRARLLQKVDRRWLGLYERARGRYGRGLAVVRERVCQGCFITLPTSVSPAAAGTLTVCESCSRLLYWP